MIGWTYSRTPVQLYGRRWCAHTQMLRRYMDRAGIPYVYHDMDRDPSALTQVRWWTGMDVNPVLSVNGNILIEPSMEEVNWTLRNYAYA